jgi:hypothetical protein
MGIALVWNIETGLECGQWLPRLLKITVTGAKLLHVDSVSIFSATAIKKSHRKET